MWIIMIHMKCQDSILWKNKSKIVFCWSYDWRFKGYFFFFFFMQLCLKRLSEMANSEDPNKTDPSGAVWYGSALFACAILSETLMFEILGYLSNRNRIPYLPYILGHLYSLPHLS